MTEGKNIAIALGILFLIGGLIPVVVGVFYDVDNIELTGIYSSMYERYNDGITIDILLVEVTLIGSDTGEFIGNQIQGYALFDNHFPILAKAIIILIILLLSYAVIKALPTT